MVNHYLAANRFGLGRRPGDPRADDVAAALKHQIDAFDPAPQPIAALPGRVAIAADYAAYRADRMERRRAARTTPDDGDRADAMRGQERQRIRRHYNDAVAARLAVAVASPTPFAERMVHFWANHFAVSADKQAALGFIGNHEFDAIRPHVMGRFADLLRAAVRHPAMLFYLDQAQSVGPDSAAATRIAARRDRPGPGLNENLAREILELHTLGVRSGYSQADVTAFARTLTGLTVAGVGGSPGARLAPRDAAAGDTVFVPQLHQPGAQTILGKRYDAAGEAQARAVLADLAAHPATARHIATKLARHFTADDPPPALVSRLEADFLASGGDLPSLYRTLIDSPEPWQGPAAMFKSPWDWTVSMLRGLGGNALGPRQNVAAMFNQLGQPVWRPGSPAGYDDKVATWAGSAALMQRVEFASRIAGRIGDRADARRLAGDLLADALAPATTQAIARADSAGQALALLFASPAFLRR